MLTSEDAARAKWCPFVRVDNNNRHHNTMTDGFQNSEKMYHCIAADCMGWRQYHLSHFKGSGEGLQATAIAALPASLISIRDLGLGTWTGGPLVRRFARAASPLRSRSA